jgi:hypothetical protein
MVQKPLSMGIYCANLLNIYNVIPSVSFSESDMLSQPHIKLRLFSRIETIFVFQRDPIWL